MAIEAHAGILGGKPVIQGTRIPVDLLLELVDAGLSVDDILKSIHISSERMCSWCCTLPGGPMRPLDTKGEVRASIDQNLSVSKRLL